MKWLKAYSVPLSSKSDHLIEKEILNLYSFQTTVSDL